MHCPFNTCVIDEIFKKRSTQNLIGLLDVFPVGSIILIEPLI
jgi:hypothetical protein